MEMFKFANFENSYKINENSYNVFFTVVIRRKRKLYISEKTFWG